MGLVSTEDIDLGYEWVLASVERWVVVAGASIESADVTLMIFQLACGCCVCGVEAYATTLTGLDDCNLSIHSYGGILLTVGDAMVWIIRLAGDAFW